MNTITFADHDNFLAFEDIAHGMWCNFRDDNEQPELGIISRLIDELTREWDKAAKSKPQYPLTLPLSATTVEMAQRVLENSLEYERTDDDPSDPPQVREGGVTIQ